MFLALGDEVIIYLLYFSDTKYHNQSRNILNTVSRNDLFSLEMEIKSLSLDPFKLSPVLVITLSLIPWTLSLLRFPRLSAFARDSHVDAFKYP